MSIIYCKTVLFTARHVFWSSRGINKLYVEPDDG